MYSHFFGLYGMALLDWSCSASGKLGPHQPFALLRPVRRPSRGKA